MHPKHENGGSHLIIILELTWGVHYRASRLQTQITLSPLKTYLKESLAPTPEAQQHDSIL
jgi:hypothetical protein